MYFICVPLCRQFTHFAQRSIATAFVWAAFVAVLGLLVVPSVRSPSQSAKKKQKKKEIQNPEINKAIDDFFVAFVVAMCCPWQVYGNSQSIGFVPCANGACNSVTGWLDRCAGRKVDHLEDRRAGEGESLINNGIVETVMGSLGRSVRGLQGRSVRLSMYCRSYWIG